jgi:muramoyltetrapeptide carboxypeptidase
VSATSTALSWPRLQPGDVVRLVSPASTPTEDGVAEARAVLESWGLEVEMGRHVLDRWGYCAGTDADRLADLDDAFRDPRVRAVVATRGGAGAYRICEEVDVEAVVADPKPLLGFSDITYLHAALWRACRLPGVHGWLVGEDAVASARRILLDGAPVEVRPDPATYTAQVRRGGVARGTLLGGHLSTLAHLVGAGLPDLGGAVLLLEDKRDIGLGRVDRQLTQLRRAGALDGLAGVALGMFTGFDDYEDRGWTLLEVLDDHLDRLGVPVLGGLPIGHGRTDQVCVPLGADAVLDADAGTLTVASPAAG